MDFEDIDNAASIPYQLEEQGITLQQVISLLDTAETHSMDLTVMVQLNNELKKHGLSPKDSQETLVLKKELEAMGFTLDSLKPIVELVKNYGSIQGITEAVSEYSSLADIESQTVVAKEGLEVLNQDISRAKDHLGDVQKQTSDLEEPLKAYEKVVSLGFGLDELTTLSELAEKYGGAEKVLQAVTDVTDHSHYLSMIEKAKVELASMEAKIQQLETQYGHLKATITICETLYKKHGLGLDAISTILSIAEKYGKINNVLKGLDSYGNLQKLQEEADKLEGAVAELQSLLAQLEGKNNKTLEQFESLNAIAMKTGAEVAKVENRLQESKALHKIVSFINDPASANYQEYGQLAVAILKSILKWVTSNEKHFLYPNRMKSALQDLITELGGD
jgi:predicted  nucleic acid-binding Zn-ribbon protein